MAAGPPIANFETVGYDEAGLDQGVRRQSNSKVVRAALLGTLWKCAVSVTRNMARTTGESFLMRKKCKREGLPRHACLSGPTLAMGEESETAERASVPRIACLESENDARRVQRHWSGKRGCVRRVMHARAAQGLIGYFIRFSSSALMQARRVDGPTCSRPRVNRLVCVRLWHVQSGLVAPFDARKRWLSAGWIFCILGHLRSFCAVRFLGGAWPWLALRRNVRVPFWGASCRQVVFGAWEIRGAGTGRINAFLVTNCVPWRRRNG